MSRFVCLFSTFSRLQEVGTGPIKYSVLFWFRFDGTLGFETRSLQYVTRGWSHSGLPISGVKRTPEKTLGHYTKFTFSCVSVPKVGAFALEERVYGVTTKEVQNEDKVPVSVGCKRRDYDSLIVLDTSKGRWEGSVSFFTVYCAWEGSVVETTVE